MKRVCPLSTKKKQQRRIARCSSNNLSWWIMQMEREKTKKINGGNWWNNRVRKKRSWRKKDKREKRKLIANQRVIHVKRTRTNKHKSTTLAGWQPNDGTIDRQPAPSHPCANSPTPHPQSTPTRWFTPPRFLFNPPAPTRNQYNIQPLPQLGSATLITWSSSQRLRLTPREFWSKPSLQFNPYSSCFWNHNCLIEQSLLFEV